MLWEIRCELLRRRTCAGVRLLSVDLQEDKCREEQQPAAGLIRGFSQQGPPALRRGVQDTAEAATSVGRGKPWGRWGTGGRGEGAACLQRPQGHRERSAGGRRHGRCLMIFLYCICLLLSLQWFFSPTSLFFSSLKINSALQILQIAHTVHKPLFSTIWLGVLFFCSPPLTLPI